MLKDWQFNILFFVGVGGAIVLLIGPDIGLDIEQNPLAVGGVGAILTFILAQKRAISEHQPPKEEDNDSDG